MTTGGIAQSSIEKYHHDDPGEQSAASGDQRKERETFISSLAIEVPEKKTKITKEKNINFETAVALCISEQLIEKISRLKNLPKGYQRVSFFTRIDEYLKCGRCIFTHAPEGYLKVLKALFMTVPHLPSQHQAPSSKYLFDQIKILSDLCKPRFQIMPKSEASASPDQNKESTNHAHKRKTDQHQPRQDINLLCLESLCESIDSPSVGREIAKSL